ncbi:MAG TPA: HEAT repeat domain-containing protein [Pirellulales bacterium]|nr:HEAT repeat domain-containing protein [Pirellulales bacterium]
MTDPESLRQCLTLLGHRNPKVRCDAIEGLMNLDDPDDHPAAAEALIGALGDADEVVREAAAGGLGQLWPASEPMVSALIEALADPRPNVRRAAAESLCLLDADSAEAVAPLVALIDDEAVAEDAILALGPIGSAAAAAVPRLIDELNSRRHVEAVARSLDPMGPAAAAAVPALQARLDQRDAATRAAVARALGSIGRASKPALPALLASLADEAFFAEAQAQCDQAAKKRRPQLGGQPGYYRLIVAEAIWNIAQHELAVPMLVDALRDTVADVRGRAVRALREIGLPASSVVAELMRLMDDPDVLARITVIGALGSFGAGAIPALPALAKALGDENADTRRAAVRAFGALGALAQPVLPILRELMDIRGGPVCVPAALAVFEITGETSAMETIIAALRDGGPKTAMQAAGTLSDMEPAADWALDALTSVAADPLKQPDVRRAAKRAIRDIRQAR